MKWARATVAYNLGTYKISMLVGSIEMEKTSSNVGDLP